MKVKFLNGKKVYVEDLFTLGGRDSEWESDDGTVQIIKHSEIIRVLNCLFEDAESTPENIPYDLSNIISGICRNKRKWRPSIDIIAVKTINYNDPRKIKRARRIVLHQEASVEYDEKLRAIKGGLYKTTEPKVVESSIISDEFKAWRKAQSAKTDNHDNA